MTGWQVTVTVRSKIADSNREAGRQREQPEFSTVRVLRVVKADWVGNRRSDTGTGSRYAGNTGDHKVRS